MGKIYTIRLEANDLGQLLEGLQSHSESRHNTAEYLESGYNPREDIIVEECTDAEESCAIADHYDRIIATTETQMNSQGDLS